MKTNSYVKAVTMAVNRASSLKFKSKWVHVDQWREFMIYKPRLHKLEEI